MAARARRSRSLARTGVVMAVPLSPLPVPGYAGSVGLGIRRTSDGGHLVGPPTVGVSDLGSESAEVTRHDDDGAGRRGRPRAEGQAPGDVGAGRLPGAGG